MFAIAIILLAISRSHSGKSMRFLKYTFYRLQFKKTLIRRQGRIEHFRIKRPPLKVDGRVVKYYQVETESFDSLYNLINHYKTKPLHCRVGANFSLTNSNPISTFNFSNIKGKPYYFGQTCTSTLSP